MQMLDKEKRLQQEAAAAEGVRLAAVASQLDSKAGALAERESAARYLNLTPPQKTAK